MAAPTFRRVLLAAVLFAASAAASGTDIRIPDGPGSNLVYSKCQACHDLQYVKDAKGLMAAQWSAVVASMQDYGLKISDQDKAAVLKYLTTYLGPNPPPAQEAAAPSSKLDGKALWQQNCAACHGAKGLGQPGYFPPLAGNPDLSKDQVFPALVVLNGLSGPITVQGQKYNGVMPALGHLSDAEIATIVNFIRTEWGNKEQASKLEPVTPEMVAEQRKQTLSPAQVHALREKFAQ